MSEELVKPRSLKGLVLELAYCWNWTACRVWSLQKLSFAEARLAVEAHLAHCAGTFTPRSKQSCLALTHIHTKTKATS